MRVLVACEFGGRVRDAFLRAGHDAWSCDLRPSWSRADRHVRGDARPLLREPWDLVIAHPPCTYLTQSGVQFLGRRGRRERMAAACRFFNACLTANAPRVCVENPVMHGEARALVGAAHAQIVHPWQFGEADRKRTCLWLKNLPPLRPTCVLDPSTVPQANRNLSPSPRRWMLRSLTYWGVARAMAEQWGALPTTPCPFSV